MRTRIRTVKPELFSHEDLFDAEMETGLPLRLAFIGLWTACDREGRFQWRPRALKAAVMPYDDIDFSRVLDALATRGFVVKYRVNGTDFGHVPGFARHQIVNNRESASEFPPPPQSTDCEQQSTRDQRVLDACSTRHDLAQGEGKGREGKGKGKEEVESATAASTCAPEREQSQQSPDGDWTMDRLHDEVMAAVGLKGGIIPSYWMPPIAPRHVWRWHSELGLTPSEIIDTARIVRSRFSDPPNGPKALDTDMKRLAGEKAAPAMRPEARSAGRSAAPEDPEAAKRERWRKRRAQHQPT